MLQKIKQELKAGRHLLQFGFLKTLGQGLGMMAPLVIAKFFSEESFGSYVLARMVIFFFVSLLLASSQTPFIVYANQERTQTGKINKSLSIQAAFLGISIILFAVLTVVLNTSIQSFAEISFIDVLFMCVGFVGIALKTFLCNLFMATGERIKNSFAELVFGVIVLGIIVLLCLTGIIRLRTVFLTYFISAIGTFLIFIRFIDFSQLLPLEFDRQYFKNIFDFTKWAMFGATALYLVNWVDNIILRAFNTSLGDIGSYGLAYQIFKGLVMLTYVLNAYFLPFISEHINNTDKIRAYLFSKRPKILFAGMVGLVLVFLCVPPFFRLFYKDRYQESVLILRILLFGGAIALYNSFYIPLINALKEYRFIQTLNVVHISLKVLLSLALIPAFGLKGAAIATVGSYLCKAVTIEVWFRLRLRGKLHV